MRWSKVGRWERRDCCPLLSLAPENQTETFCADVLRNADSTPDYEYVIYVDSDAYLADLDLSLPRLFDRFVGAGNGSGKSLFFSSDRPFSSKPNSGFIVINNTAEAMGFLWRWWNTNLVSSAAPGPCCCKTCWTTSKRHRQSCSDPRGSGAAPGPSVMTDCLLGVAAACADVLQPLPHVRADAAARRGDARAEVRPACLPHGPAAAHERDRRPRHAC